MEPSIGDRSNHETGMEKLKLRDYLKSCGLRHGDGSSSSLAMNMDRAPFPFLILVFSRTTKKRERIVVGNVVVCCYIKQVTKR